MGMSSTHPAPIAWSSTGLLRHCAARLPTHAPPISTARRAASSSHDVPNGTASPRDTAYSHDGAHPWSNISVLSTPLTTDVCPADCISAVNCRSSIRRSVPRPNVSTIVAATPMAAT